MTDAVSSETLESKIIGQLIGHYQVDEQVAKSISRWNDGFISSCSDDNQFKWIRFRW